MRYGPIVLALLAVGMVTGPSLCAEPPADEAKSVTSTAVSAQAEDSDAAGAVALEENAIKELGVKEGESVDSGFIFFDGRYIDAPYTVSQRGRRLFVNEVMIYQWDRWPLPDLRVDEDPGYPPGLTEKSIMDDVIKGNSENSPWQRKGRYLDQHFPPDVARQKLADWFRGLPFVESVEFVGRTSNIKIKMKNGKEQGVGLSPPPAESSYSWHFTNKDIVKGLEYDRNKYEAYLKKGKAVFIFSKGHPVTMIRKKAARDLGLMTEILRSDRTKEEKIDLLQRMEFLRPPSMGGNEMFMPLITQFQASEQLEERIDQLVKETGVTPRTLQDLPAEAPLERAMRLRKEADQKSKEP
ncbi:MAG TPA: hypothetical protein VM219_05240 [Phycisphaerae bacterium]|nr:hypothetical protein [Phycisphaerae bacterium]